MNSQTRQANLISIDLLRFFAAFSVYYYHQHLGALLAEYTHIPLLTYTDALGATYAVPLFFLLSGYCIHLSNIVSLKKQEPLKLKKYYINRLWRIYPAYLIAFFISILALLVTNPQTTISLKDIIKHVFVLQGFSVSSFNSINVVLWTITVEMAFYAIYPLFYYISNKTSSSIALLISAVVSIISIGYFLQLGDPLTLPERYLFTNLWFAWCFGAWLCDKINDEPLFFKSWKWFQIITIIFLLFTLDFYISIKNKILITDTLNIIIWAPALIWFINLEKTLSNYRIWLRIPIALGISSYSLYLLHEPLITLKNHFIHLYFNSGLINSLMIIAIFLIPFLTYLYYRWIEYPLLTIRKSILTYFNIS